MTRTEQSAQPTVVHDLGLDGRVAPSRNKQRVGWKRIGLRGRIALGVTVAALVGATVVVVAAGSGGGGAKPVASSGPTTSRAPSATAEARLSTASWAASSPGFRSQAT